MRQSIPDFFFSVFCCIFGIIAWITFDFLTRTKPETRKAGHRIVACVGVLLWIIAVLIEGGLYISQNNSAPLRHFYDEVKGWITAPTEIMTEDIPYVAPTLTYTEKEQRTISVLRQLPQNTPGSASAQLIIKYLSSIQVSVGKTGLVFVLQEKDVTLDELFRLSGDLIYVGAIASYAGESDDWELQQIKLCWTESSGCSISLWVEGHNNITRIAQNPQEVYSVLETDFGPESNQSLVTQPTTPANYSRSSPRGGELYPLVKGYTPECWADFMCLRECLQCLQ
jgi:hypothetical protein